MASTAAEKEQDFRLTGYIALILTVTYVASMFDTIESTFYALIIPIWMKEWNVAPTVFALIASVTGWVSLGVGLVVPAFADIIGRRKMFIWGSIGYFIVNSWTAFAQNTPQLLILRTVVRIPYSAYSVGGLIVAEASPTRWRSVLLAGLNSMYPLAYSLAAFAAAFVIPNYGWRALYILGLIPVAIVVVLNTRIKETGGFQRVAEKRAARGIQRPRLDQMLIMPWKRYPRRMLITTIVYTLYIFAWTGFSIWMPTWLVRDVGLPFATASVWQGIWLLCSVPPYWICAFMAKKWGNKVIVPIWVIPGGLLWMSLALFQWQPGQIFWLGLVLNFVVTGSYGVGATAFPKEMFPTEVRSTATAGVLFIGGLIGSFAPLAMALWVANTSIAASFVIPGICFLILGPVFFFFAPETAGRFVPDMVDEMTDNITVVSPTAPKDA